MKNLLLLCFSLALAATVFGQAPSPKPGTPSSTPKAVIKGPPPVDKTTLEPKWPAPDEAPAVVTPDPTQKAAKDLYDQARAALLQRKFDAALPLLLQAEKLAPGQVAIENLLGITYALLRRFDDAVTTFQKAVKLDPKLAPVHANLCNALAATGRRSDAIEECREAVRLDPERARFRTALANLYLLDNRSGDALDLLNPIYDKAQNDLVYLAVLADTYFYEGDYSEAADIYERITRDWPKVSIVYVRLSGVYDYLGRYADSIAAARKFAEMEPNLAFAHLNLGQKLSDFGFFDESIEPLEKASAMEPKSSVAFSDLANVYEILGDKENALKNMRRAYQRGDKSFSLSLRLGRALGEYGLSSEAIEPLEHANTLVPNQPEIMRSLGLEYIYAARFDEGVDLIERAQQISPLPPNITIDVSGIKKGKEMLAHFDEIAEYVKKNPNDAKAHYVLAQAYTFKHQLADVEREYLEMVRVEPTFDRYNELAIFYEDHGQFEKAIGAFNKAIELNPNHVTYISLSYALMKFGHLDEALEAAKRSVEIKSTLLESRLWLGDLYLKKGLRDEALREYQAGFDLASGDVRPNFKLAWLYVRTGNKQGALRHYEILRGITSAAELKNLEMCIRAHFGPLP